MRILLLPALLACSGEVEAPPKPAPLPVAAPQPSSGFAPPATAKPDRVKVVVNPEPEPPPAPADAPEVAVAAVDPPPAPTAPPEAPRPEAAPPKAAPPKAAPPEAAPPKAEPQVSPAPPPAPAPAPKVAPAPAPQVAKVQAKPAPPPPKPLPAPTGDPLAGLGTCEPDEVEGPAREGRLSSAQRGCMELALGKSDPATRDRLSLALIANAHAQGDQETWADLVARHLQEVDATNPSLAYRYALWRFENGDVNGAYRYADQALSNRAQWANTEYATRTYAAHKLRAAAAQAQWKAVEAARAEGRAGDDEARSAREKTGLSARAWSSFADESGLDAAPARALCRISDTDC